MRLEPTLVDLLGRVLVARREEVRSFTRELLLIGALACYAIRRVILGQRHALERFGAIECVAPVKGVVV